MKGKDGKALIKGKDGLTYLKGHDGEFYVDQTDVDWQTQMQFSLGAEAEEGDLLDFLEDGLEDLGKAIALAEAEVAKGQRPATVENIRPGTAIERTDGSVVANKGGKVMVKPSVSQVQSMKGLQQMQMQQMMLMRGKGPTLPDTIGDAPEGEDFLDFLDETNVAAIPEKPADPKDLVSQADGADRAKTPSRPAHPKKRDRETGRTRRMSDRQARVASKPALREWARMARQERSSCSCPLRRPAAPRCRNVRPRTIPCNCNSSSRQRERPLRTPAP
jgi:hypothetical protein